MNNQNIAKKILIIFFSIVCILVLGTIAAVKLCPLKIINAIEQIVQDDPSLASELQEGAIEGFAEGMADALKDAMPQDVPKEKVDKIAKIVEKNAYPVGEYFIKNRTAGLNDAAMIAAYTASYPNLPAVILCYSDVPEEYWEDILSKVQAANYEFMKTESKLKEPQENLEEFLSIKEDALAKLTFDTYEAEIDKLCSENKISQETAKQAKNMDKMEALGAVAKKLNIKI